MAAIETNPRLGVVKTDGAHGVRWYGSGFDVFDALFAEPPKCVSHLVTTAPNRQNGVGMLRCDPDVLFAYYRPEQRDASPKVESRHCRVGQLYLERCHVVDVKLKSLGESSEGIVAAESGDRLGCGIEPNEATRFGGNVLDRL